MYLFKLTFLFFNRYYLTLFFANLTPCKFPPKKQSVSHVNFFINLNLPCYKKGYKVLYTNKTFKSETISINYDVS